MPQPGPVAAAPDDLIRAYADAEQRLLDQYVALVSDPSRHRQAARVREMLASVDGELQALDAHSRSWFATEYPAVYQAGAVGVADAVSGQFSWTQPHRGAVQELAANGYQDLLANTDHASASLKRAVRDQATIDVARSVIDGTTTPQAAARNMTDAVQAETGAYTVTYSNGAQYSLADYADTALRTATANAYNQGTLKQGAQEGVEWWEIADGPGCFAGDTHLGAYGGLVGMVRVWYDGPSVVLLGENDLQLTVGPHHPVLTVRGWVEAQYLTPQDEVIYDGRFDGAPPGAEDHFVEVPTAEDSFTALSNAMGGAGRRPYRRHDLHGDAQHGQGEVEVVATERGLLVERDPALFQHRSEDALMRSDADLPGVIGDGVTGEGGLAELQSTGSSVGRLDLRSSLNIVHRGPDGEVAASRCAEPLRSGRALPSLDWRGELNSAVLTDRRDWPLRLPSATSDGEPSLTSDRHAPRRAVDASGSFGGASTLSAWGTARLVEIRHEHFRGFMYDATAIHGVLFANHIVIRNCGLVTHDDGDIANGMVAPADVCEQFPLSHPRCGRAFLPRPDITSQGAADDATVPIEDRQAAAEVDRQRTDGHLVAGQKVGHFSVPRQAQLRARRTTRAEHPVRQPRQPRTPRQVG